MSETTAQSSMTIPPPPCRLGPDDEVAAVFARLRADLAQVASWAGDDAAGDTRLGGELLHRALVELVALGGVLDAHTAAVAEMWRTDGFWGLDGSRSAPARLSRETRRSLGSCRAILGRARKVHANMPATRDAWAAGAVTTDAVDLLTQANTPAREPVFARDEPTLTEQAAALRYGEFAKTVQYWKHRADAELGRDGTPPEPETFLSLHRTFDGATSLTGVLDPVGGAIVEETLRLIEDELRAADTATGNLRSAGARRAAALVEMATRARSLPQGQGRRPAPLFTVILGEDAFAGTCELFTGQVITPADLRAWLNHATVQFFPFDETKNGPAAASRKHPRFFTGALRTAIQLRDRHCQHPSGCDEPISRCDVDHTTPYAHGGATTLTSGRLLCTAHNRIPTLRDPSGRSPTEPDRARPSHAAPSHAGPPSAQ